MTLIHLPLRLKLIVEWEPVRHCISRPLNDICGPPPAAFDRYHKSRREGQVVYTMLAIAEELERHGCSSGG